jgi:hypothetical protein
LDLCHLAVSGLSDTLLWLIVATTRCAIVGVPADNTARSIAPWPRQGGCSIAIARFTLRFLGLVAFWAAVLGAVTIDTWPLDWGCRWSNCLMVRRFSQLFLQWLNLLCIL